jgi:hypothetical protein
MKQTMRKSLKEELDLIRKSKHSKRITPADVIAYAASRKGSAWYKALQREGIWDNKVAGNKWRIHRVRELMRVVSVTIIKPPDSPTAVVVPTWISIPSNGDRGHLHIDEVMQDPELRYRLLGRCIAELQSIQEVPLFEELTAVYEEIQRAAADYDGNKPSSQTERRKKSSRHTRVMA